MINFKEITNANIWKVCTLEPFEEQKDFVAENIQSLAEAYATRNEGGNALPLAVYNDETLVGFIMIGKGTVGNEKESELIKKNYSLWRLMIDKKYQGKGFGRQTLDAAMALIHTYPFGKADKVWLSYEPENVRARFTESTALLKTAKCVAMKSLLFMICESDSDAAAPPLMCGRRGAAGEPQQSIIITNTLLFQRDVFFQRVTDFICFAAGAGSIDGSVRCLPYDDSVNIRLFNHVPISGNGVILPLVLRNVHNVKTCGLTYARKFMFAV